MQAAQTDRERHAESSGLTGDVLWRYGGSGEKLECETKQLDNISFNLGLHVSSKNE